MERLKAASLTDRLKQAAPPDRYGAGSNIQSRKERREQEKAQGLVPFAVKLNGELVRRIHARAQERQLGLNEVVAELLEKGLGG